MPEKSERDKHLQDTIWLFRILL